MPAVSVIIPTFKRVEQTVKTIQLLLASDGVGKEFDLEIIVSDSTPDESLHTAVSTRFGPNLIYVRPEKAGIAANKNAGVKAARHQILIFCDSDMEVEKHTVQNALDSLKQHETAAMVGGRVVWRGGPHEGEVDRPRPEDRMKLVGTTRYTEALYSRFIATYKDVFTAVGGYDEIIFNMRGEGSDLSARYWRAGYPLVFEESIVVHHVHEAPDSAALRVAHPEWGIAKDLLLLGYKYKMFEDDYPAFAQTVAMNFTPLGSQGTYRMLQGIGLNYDLIVAMKPALDAFRAHDAPAYDFKFLEVFSKAKLFEACVGASKQKLSGARAATFVGNFA